MYRIIKATTSVTASEFDDEINFEQWLKYLANKDMLIPDYAVDEVPEDAVDRILENWDYFSKFDRRRIVQDLQEIQTFMQSDEFDAKDWNANNPDIRSLRIKYQDDIGDPCEDLIERLYKNKEYYLDL
jgi:hypothetical protein